MPLSRRDLIAGLPSLLAFAQCIPFFDRTSAQAQPAPASGPAPRMRLEDFVKHQKRVDSLKRGVKVMQGRLPSDPKSWFFQAAVHAVSDDFLQDALQRDPKVPQVDQQKFWNKCPHFGQPSAEFLLWHRAYVFYFERILRDAAQDPMLSLPYWNYTDATQRGFPALFANPEPDASGKPTNPLFDLRREIAFMQGEFDLSGKAVSMSVAFASKEFFGPDEISGFAGGVADTDPQTKGLIEQSPHDQIHFAVGGAIASGLSPTPDAGASGLMSVPGTAAFDPIFWLHHSNIERLWTVWDCLKDRKWGTVPAEAWLRDKPWWFNDFDGKVVNESRLHYLSADLGVRYDSDDPACKPFSRTPPIPEVVVQAPQADTHMTAITLAFTKEVESQELGRNNSQVTLSPSKRTSQSVTLVNKAAPGPGAVKSLMASTPLIKRRVLLEIADVDYESAPSVGYEVYVNLPKDAVADSASPNFVGTLALFGIKHDASGHAHGKSAQQFDITRVVNELADPSQITVSLVPFDLLTPKGNAQPLRREAGVTIGTMRVIVVESKPSLQ